MHPEKQKNIYNLPPQERYEYLIRRSADFEEIWLLKNEKGDIPTLKLAGSQFESIPVWPEQEFVRNNIKGSWEKCSPFSMDIYEFIKWLDQLKEENMSIAIFPLLDRSAIEVDPILFKSHLIEECEQYE